MKCIDYIAYPKNRRLTISLTVLSVIMLVVISISSLLPLSHAQKTTIDSAPSCITYDSADNIITITCNSATLTDVDNQLKDANILYRENTADADQAIWLLNAGIVVAKGSTFYINSTDTTWLKITSDKATPRGILVSGSLKIDSVKLTSWNPETNDYIKFDVAVRPADHKDREKGYDYDQKLRPFIKVEEEATGTTDITNSEIAYIGYDDEVTGGGFYGSGSSGLNYYGGNGSIIRGNEIHHNRFGFYSAGVGNIILENNHVYDNYMYGFDPHTETYNMIIRNNTVHDSGTMGIICSLDCYNITIEDNEVYNNTDAGIMFSRNMYNSVARNNNVYDEIQCIFVSESHNNEVYNNQVSDCENGIYLKGGSSKNNIYDNTIVNATDGILVNTGASDNTFSSNTIINATEFGINVDEDSGGNTFNNNKLINSKVAEVEEEQDD
jgi:mannuronan 5-epimerase